MPGGAYVAICLGFALASGIIGRIKGSPFWIWFLIGGVLPVLGLLAALFYRYESDVPDVPCPSCGGRCKIHDAVCMRCGCELDPGTAPPAAH